MSLRLLSWLAMCGLLREILFTSYMIIRKRFCFRGGILLYFIGFFFSISSKMTWGHAISGEKQGAKKQGVVVLVAGIFLTA